MPYPYETDSYIESRRPRDAINMSSPWDEYDRAPHQAAADAAPIDPRVRAFMQATTQPGDTADQPFGYTSDVGFANAQDAIAKQASAQSGGIPIAANPGTFRLGGQWTAKQEQQIRSHAMQEQSRRNPKAMVGQGSAGSFVMAPSVNISQAKAQAFLDADERDRLTAQADEDRKRKMTQEDADRGEAQRRQLRSEGIQDMNNRTTNLQNEEHFVDQGITRGQNQQRYNDQHQLDQLAIQNAAADARDHITPGKQRKMDYINTLANNAKDPRAKAFLMQTQGGMAGVDLPSDVIQSASRGTPQEQSAQAMAIVNDPMVAAGVQRARQHVSALTSSVGPFGARYASDDDINQIAKYVKDASDAASSLSPGTDPAFLRRTIINQALADMNSSNAPSIARAIETALDNLGN